MGKPKPIADRLADLRARRNALGAKVDALAAKDRQQKRKNDTRRKIVVGGAVLTAIEKDPMLARMVTRILAASVGRAQDRAVIADLLGPLSPLPANGQNATVQHKDHVQAG